MPTGNMLRAARALAGLNAANLAKLAGIDASTISRLEKSRDKSTRGMAQTVEAVQIALLKRGVKIIPDEGVIMLVKKARR